MKYKVLMFDADETLFDFKKSERAAFEKTMLDYDLEYDEGRLKLYSAINEAIWKEFEKGLITQEELKIERFKRLAKEAAFEFDEAEFARSYMKNLANMSFLFDGVPEFIESLHKDHRLVLLTNGLTDVQKGRMCKSIIAKYFDAIIISEEVKAAKPDPAIFELALKRIGHDEKNTVLMIGDSLTSDIKGGLSYGIDTCWYNPEGKENNSGLKPQYEIRSLTELWPLLD